MPESKHHRKKKPWSKVKKEKNTRKAKIKWHKGRRREENDS